MTARLTVIAWRDIPAQVVASQGRTKVRVELAQRFQLAIDRAAMNAGVTGTDAYLDEWTRTTRDCDDDLETAAHDAAARLENEYDQDRLTRLVAAAGIEEDT